MEFFQNKNLITNIKVLGLGIISLISIIVNFFLIHTALFTDKPLLFWIWPAIMIMLTIATLTLFAAVNSNKMYAMIFGLAALLSYVAIFPKDWIVLLAGIIFIAMMFWFEQRIRSEETARIDFSIRRVSAAGANVIIYAFLLLLGLNIYYNTSADFKANPEGFYEALGRSAARSTRYLGASGATGIDLNQTLDQYLETETRKQTPNYDTLPESFRQQYLENAKQEFFRQFNIQIPSSQPLSEVVAEFAVDRVRASAEKFSNLFPIIFTLIVFGLLRTFSFVIRLLSLLMTWIFYTILLKLRFFRLSKVAVEVEKLEI